MVDIFYEEIHAAIDALNRNFNGQSDKLLEKYQNKYLKTPDIFAAVRGVANIEFRLASGHLVMMVLMV